MARLNNSKLSHLITELEELNREIDQASVFDVKRLASRASDVQLNIVRELVAREIERHE
ncbi:hypothetical protein [Oceanospirillum sediminis]|uniref:Uncharacterized protein n=1 Tax=Oceanospirillum sediminis TaxID=2760088 RepID=A0A839ILZ0_9GAMM|nr:hypothetical protein [Oceanospirillum sediminis]MBB1485911.1 hypothetical protein [Oceanospirillum sediminis]